MSNTRALTVKLLTKVDENSSYSNILLDRSLQRSDLDERDKRFVSALFYGVLEREMTLDAIITDLVNKPGNKLNYTVRNILRVGLYQLRYMDSVPDNAAVDEAVELAKKSRNPAAAGFVNAMLREFIRRGKKLPKGKDRFESLAIEYSCPQWLVRKWYFEYGEEICLDMLRHSLGKAPVWARLNPLAGSEESTLAMLEQEGISCEKSDIVKGAVKLGFSGAIEESRTYKAGRLHVQDLSCQLCCLALDPHRGEVVLDMCSAPGGKTFTIAQLMEDKGQVLAFDLHANRVKLIAQGAARLGLNSVKARVNNAKEYNRGFPMADKVLVDAPCSGLGVIRRKPEIKYKSPEELERLPDIQYDILGTSSRYVKQGGRLVYSTCTVSKSENEKVVRRFLQEHEEFEAAPLGHAFSELSDQCAVTITPEMYDSDGFFIAAFVRRR